MRDQEARFRVTEDPVCWQLSRRECSCANSGRRDLPYCVHLGSSLDLHPGIGLRRKHHPHGRAACIPGLIPRVPPDSGSFCSSAASADNDFVSIHVRGQSAQVLPRSHERSGSLSRPAKVILRATLLAARSYDDKEPECSSLAHVPSRQACRVRSKCHWLAPFELHEGGPPQIQGQHGVRSFHGAWTSPFTQSRAPEWSLHKGTAQLERLEGDWE